MEIRDIISVVSAVCAIVFAYLAFTRNKTKDEREDAGTEASIMAEIGYIRANTDEIKNEQKEQRKSNLEFVTRLTQLESDVRGMESRITRLEGEK